MQKLGEKLTILSTKKIAMKSDNWWTPQQVYRHGRKAKYFVLPYINLVVIQPLLHEAIFVQLKTKKNT
jgi:lipoprotein-anchoring transpeptidase ErfK/SrfK